MWAKGIEMANNSRHSRNSKGWFLMIKRKPLGKGLLLIMSSKKAGLSMGCFNPGSSFWGIEWKLGIFRTNNLLMGLLSINKVFILGNGKTKKESS